MTVTITLTEQELLIVRECVQLIDDPASLHDLFEDEDFEVTQGDEDVERPTDAVARKLALHVYPSDQASILAEIRKVQGS